MTDTDWHDAQVIEAATPRFAEPRILLRSGEGFPDWTDRDYWEYRHDELSDVRVIVDRDGKVAPPPITDEMVEHLFEMAQKPSRIPIGMTQGQAVKQTYARFCAALRAALGGEQS